MQGPLVSFQNPILQTQMTKESLIPQYPTVNLFISIRVEMRNFTVSIFPQTSFDRNQFLK